MSQLTFISLFAGIGGLDLGLERAGLRCVAQVEIDAYCQKVLAKHWPDVPRFRDVRAVGVHNLPVADCLVGGFPCQDISNAGKRVGIEGERSGLWGEYARLIGELRPCYVVVENVAALLGRGMGVVLGDLAARGYDADWQCLPAAAVGAPHIRDRVFLIGYRAPATNQGTAGERRLLADPTGGRQWADQNDSHRSAQYDQRADPKRGGAVVADPQRHGLQGIFPTGTAARATLRGSSTWWAIEPGVGRVAHGVPARVDRLKGLGNAVVPQVAEYIWRCLVAFDAQQNEGAA